MRIRAFLTHKLSEKYKDCQDSFDLLENTYAIAIADGISQSIFPKIWADLLTYNFVCTPTISYSKDEDINPLRIRWAEEVEKVRYKKELQNDPFLWKLEENLATGKSAGATFLGLKFDRNAWSCSVIGDSCLVEISDKNEISRIICSKAESDVFDNHPDYLDSSTFIVGKGIMKNYYGELTDGKKLFLVTDALSDFLSKKQKEGDFDIIETIFKVKTQNEFEDLVNNLRNQGMHNDDTTLVIIENDNHESWTILSQTDLNQLIKDEEVVSPEKDKNIFPAKINNEQSFEENQTDISSNPIVEPIVFPQPLHSLPQDDAEVRKETTRLSGLENIELQISSHLKSLDSELEQIQVLLRILISRFSNYNKTGSGIFSDIKKDAIKFLNKTK